MERDDYIKRKRSIYFILIIATMAAGLMSRRFGVYLPDFLAAYSGDALWALMIFWGFGFLFPKAFIIKTAAFALIFSYAIEFSQLYQADWINAIRHTTLGGLVLRFGFLWSDLICYTAGVGIGVIFELIFRKRRT